MTINEKIALYEFCKKREGKEYHNLKSVGKDAVKELYFQTAMMRKKDKKPG
ncbi:MAG: hypothetical protein KAW12_26390 [Candidatus Aminicenantes bacterium]|nr:hypothetical protein [Candidatus Aminicenantes bacterium]